MATKDQPVNIEYILGATGADKMSYVGNSQGTKQMYQALAAGTKDPELQATLNKLDTFISLATCIYSGPEIEESEFNLARA